MNYRPEIDGLRAIAVISVLLYHAQIIIYGKDWFEGGFIGVDIFFVISGYLITKIILLEVEQTNKFSFAKFYERRARRILPMLLLVIGACLPFAWRTLLPADFIDFSWSALSAIGFFSNFFFYFSTTEYGADSALLKPLLHTWSLGIEEQFYLLIPVIIITAWKYRRVSLIGVFSLLFLLSIGFASQMHNFNASLNFYLPFSRFWELTAGSIIGFLEIRNGRIKNVLLAQTLSVIGACLILISIFRFDSNIPHPSFQTLQPIIGVSLLLAFCSQNDVIGRFLSSRPLVYTGLISYSLYLWHFPIFAFARLSTVSPSSYDKVSWILLTSILSILSFYLVERPFRNRQIIKTKMFLIIMIASTTALLCINYSVLLSNGFRAMLPIMLSDQDFGEIGTRKFKQNGKVCYGKLGHCSIENGDNLSRIYAFGDSHLSAMSLQLIAEIGSDFNYTEANIGGCIFVLNVSRYNTKTGKPHHCNEQMNEKRYKLIKESPSIILIGGRFPQAFDGNGFDNEEGGYEGDKHIGFKSSNSLSLEENIKITIDQLVKDGHQVILVYPIPEVGVHVPKYVIKKLPSNIRKNSTTIKSLNDDPLTTSFKIFKERTETTFKAFDAVKSSNIHRVYPHTAFCNNLIKERCVTHTDKEVYYYDDDHLSSKGSEIVAKLIVEKIQLAREKIEIK